MGGYERLSFDVGEKMSFVLFEELQAVRCTGPKGGEGQKGEGRLEKLV